MVPLIAAGCGFALLLIADIRATADGAASGNALRTAGYLACASVVAFIALAPAPWWPAGSPGILPEGRIFAGRPSFVALLCIAAALASAALLFWSVFAEIPLARKARNLGPRTAVRTGSYGLCRHPGFWWLSFLLVSLGFLRDDIGYVPVILEMILLDLLLVILQDRVFFMKMFDDYGDYAKNVPFLIPSPRLRKR